MGRIKTQSVKRVALELFQKHRDKFKPSFEENKIIVKELVDAPSKKLRNTISGYLTRLAKQESKK